MQKPTIFFDWDGTLANSMPICLAECHIALQRMGLSDLPDEIIRQCNGPTYAEACSILRVPDELHEAFMAMRKQAELELIPSTQQLFPGIREMLEGLRDKANLVIVSNGLKEYLEASVQVMGLEGTFTRIQHLLPGKNKTQLLAMLLEEMHPERSVMVGDRLGDINAGRDNGLLTVAAGFGFGNDAEYSQADVCCRTVQELNDWLQTFVEA